MADTLPWPQWDWDPKVVFKDMRLVSRHGYIGIWRGRMERPQTRASSLHSKVMHHIYKENGSDWTLVANRLGEVVAQLPQQVDAGVELGNAYLRLGRRDEAIGAYHRSLDQDKVPVEDMIAAQLRAQIELARAAPDVAPLPPKRVASGKRVSGSVTLCGSRHIKNKPNIST